MLLTGFFTVAPPVNAVIIITDDGSGNLTAPADDFGFGNVGVLNGSSGVYLGNRWVLTARHVGAGTITLGGTPFTHDASSIYHIGTADLTLFRLNSDPGLPSLTIASSAPTLGSTLYMAGNGRNRADSETTWHVDTSPQNWVWSETSFEEADATATGYKYASGNSLRWGTNRMSGTQSDVQALGYTSDVIENDFTNPAQFPLLATTHEAIVATNDSGGGVFWKNGESWELAGISILLAGFNNQPGSTALFGNESWAVDLSQYNTEILAVIPEPRHYGIILALFLGFGGYVRRKSRG
jgi:hypothetical protein